MLHTWKTFSALDGDIRYFRGHDDATAISREARRSLNSVKASFKRLEIDQNKLVLLMASFSDFSRSVSANSLQLDGFLLKFNYSFNFALA